MITIKRSVTATLLTLLLVLLSATAAWLLVDDETLMALVTERIEQASGTRISHQGPANITRTLHPTLSVENLEVSSREPGFRFQTGSLQLQIGLPGLLTGKLDIDRLWLGDTRIETGKEAAPTEPAPGQGASLPSRLLLKPVLHDMKILQLSIAHQGGEIELPSSHITELGLHANPDTDKFEASARLHMDQRSILLKAVLSDSDRIFAGKPLGFSITTLGDQLKLSAEGQIDFSRPEALVSGKLSGGTSEPGALSTGIEDFEVPGVLTLNGQLQGSFKQLALESLLVDWEGPGQSGAKLKGRIGNILGLESVELGLQGKLDKAAWLIPVLPESIGPLESAELAARITGSLPRLNVQDFSFRARSVEQLDLSLEGQLDLVSSDKKLEPANMALALAFKSPTTRAARALVFDDIPEFGAITGSADIRSESGDPSFENILVATKDPKGLQVDLAGRIDKFPLNPDKPNTGYRLDVRMQADKASLMAERVGFELPLATPVDLGYRIEGDTQALQLNDIKLSSGEQSSVLIAAKGRLLFGDWDNPDPLQSLDLDIDASSSGRDSLNAALGRELPDLGALTAHARVHTVSGKHRITEARIQTIDGAPVNVVVSGDVGVLRLFPEFELADVKLQASADSADFSSLNQVFGVDELIPDLGPLKASARISGTHTKLALSDARVLAGDAETPTLKATASIEDLGAMSGVRSDVELSMDGKRFASMANLGDDADPGPLEGKLAISDTDGSLGIDTLHIHSTRQDLLSINVDGKVGDFSDPDSIQLQARFDARDLQLAGALIHREWPAIGPVQLVGQIKGGSDTAGFSGTLKMDKTEIDATLAVSTNSQPPRARGRITAREFFIPDLAEKSVNDKKKNKNKKQETETDFFSREPVDLDWLNKAELDLSINIESFDNQLSVAESAKLDIKVKSGQLTVKPARILYPKGQLDAELQIDTLAKTPQLGFKAFGDNLDPWKGLGMDSSKEQFDAEMDIDVTLTSSGASPHEIASNTSGNVYVNIEEGKIRRALIDLLFIDIIGWAWQRTTDNKFYDVHCGVMDLDVQKGQVSTKAFLIDGKTITVTGEGTIDLAAEQIDYTMLPKKKSRLMTRAEPVTIKGPLNDPSVKSIPVKTAATKYGTLLFAPYIFVGITAAEYLGGAIKPDDSKRSPCRQYANSRKAGGEEETAQ